jgi:maltokinase
MAATGLDVSARWYAGKGREVRALADAASVPVPGGGRLRAADVTYADGGTERYLLVDGAPGLWGRLLEALRAGPLPGVRGRLELRPGPALPAGIATGERLPDMDQTNTLAVLGEALLVKAYRRLQPGVHPEVEVLAALAGTDAPVPGFAGSVHLVEAEGTETAVALVQRWLPGAEDGWEAPIARATAAMPAAGDPAEWTEAGAVAGRLHAALAAAFGTRPGGPGELRAWHAAARADLRVAAAEDPELARAAPAAEARLGALLDAPPPRLMRVHGDLHCAQVLRAPGSPPLVIDFEGDPLRPLPARRAPDTPLRDLAALLRSVDHLGAAAAQRGGADPEAWTVAARAAVLAGYGAAAPWPVNRGLLGALEVAKGIGEFLYAHRVLPEWAYAPRHGLRRLLAGAA